MKDSESVICRRVEEKRRWTDLEGELHLCATNRKRRGWKGRRRMNDGKSNEGQGAMRIKAISRREMTSREDSSTDKNWCNNKNGEETAAKDDDERMDMTLAETRAVTALATLR